MRKKAQVSVEYILIIGLILLTLTIAVVIAFYYSSTAQHQIRMNQIDKIGKKIADTSDSIYYLGAPSKATIELNMPEKVKDITIFRTTAPSKDFIQFTYYGTNQDTIAIYYIQGRFNGTTEQYLDTPKFTNMGLKQLQIIAVNEGGTTKIFLNPI